LFFVSALALHRHCQACNPKQERPSPRMSGDDRSTKKHGLLDCLELSVDMAGWTN
jgi:hypothetical protein